MHLLRIQGIIAFPVAESNVFPGAFHLNGAEQAIPLFIVRIIGKRVVGGSILSAGSKQKTPDLFQFSSPVRPHFPGPLIREKASAGSFQKARSDFSVQDTQPESLPAHLADSTLSLCRVRWCDSPPGWRRRKPVIRSSHC